MTRSEPPSKDILVTKAKVHEKSTMKSAPRIHRLQGLRHFILSLLVVAGTLMYRYLKMGPFIPLACSLVGHNCPVDVATRGYVNENYQAVKDAFKENFLLGHEVGAGVAAYVDNKLVVDLQAGWQNEEDLIPFSEDTLQVVFSSTKVLVSQCIILLSESQLLKWNYIHHIDQYSRRSVRAKRSLVV